MQEINKLILGPQYKKKDIPELINNSQAVFEEVSPADIHNRIAELIKDEKVIGLVQGRMEFGPRALGARSIIGDARSAKMQSIINLKIKFRESFRPFAPSVLEEKAQDYFKLRTVSPYMLLVAQVQENKIHPSSRNERADGINRLKVLRSVIPAVTHVDYSARVQTVSEANNPYFYKVIKAFEDLTGCPVIINTSFNIRGEPIVCTPADAYRCFMCTEMDYLVIENYIFDKEKQPNRQKYKKEELILELD